LVTFTKGTGTRVAGSAERSLSIVNSITYFAEQEAARLLAILDQFPADQRANRRLFM
jgi:hypothetical protein